MENTDNKELNDTISTNSLLSWFNIVVRLVGIGIMLIGVWTAWRVLSEGWALYDNPAHVTKWAKEVESATNLNKFVHGSVKNAAPAEDKVDLSYFAAWIIVVALLIVIGMVGTWALGEGGRLALYNADTERIAKAMVKEIIQEMNAIHNKKS